MNKDNLKIAWDLWAQGGAMPDEPLPGWTMEQSPDRALDYWNDKPAPHPVTRITRHDIKEAIAEVDRILSLEKLPAPRIRPHIPAPTLLDLIRNMEK